MSTLAQFFPNGTKSIQRGVISLSGVTSNTATLSPSVDTSKTRLRFLGSTASSGATVGSVQAQLVLTNGTTVTATRDGSAGIVTVSWEIEESY